MLRKKDTSTFIDYFEDNSGLAGGYAEEIVFPETERETVEFFKEIAQEKKTVTISGAGTGIVGGRIPFGGTILSTAKLNKIVDISKDNKGRGIAVVEPGVSIELLSKESAKFQLAYFPDPTEKNAFIGATVATNASGAQGFKYGPTRNHIKAVHVILPSGDLINIRRGQFAVKNRLYIKTSNKNHIECSLPSYRLPSIKNSAGYCIYEGSDLIDLFIGQEGTLGFISQIEVSLGKVPEKSFSGLVFFDTQIQAVSFVNVLKKQSLFNRKEGETDAIDAACIEYFDEYSLKIIRKKYSQIPKYKKAAVYFDQNVFTSNSLHIINQYIKFIENKKIKADEVWFAESRHDRELINAIRYDLPVLVNEIIKRNGFSKISTDIATNDAKFPEILAFYIKKLNQETIPYCIFGHIGENHLHVNLMPESKNEFASAKKLYQQFIEKAVALGGTIAAEHGIGKLKREYLPFMFEENSIKEMLKIKKAIDPNLLLGRGTIFDETLFLNI